MTITVEAIYENGMLKPSQPLPLVERQRVEVMISLARGGMTAIRPMICCDDAAAIEWAAQSPDLAFPEVLPSDDDREATL